MSSTTLKAESLPPLLIVIGGPNGAGKTTAAMAVLPEVLSLVGVRNGGHHIPDEVVLRRYERSMDNLKQKYIPLADVWLIFDNSNDNPVLIAEGEQEANMIHVYNDSTWQQLMKGAQT